MPRQQACTPKAASNLTGTFAHVADAQWPTGAKVAIAVSGGGDSLALMHLMAHYAREGGRALPHVLTVDHALRPGSQTEAEQVLVWAASAGLQADILTRKGPPPLSDIEAKARESRYRLIGQWCQAHGIDTVCLAHTIDDQAETFLIRLLRGSGVDGLAAMQAHSPFPQPGFDGVTVWRPLLGIARAQLRTYLSERGQPWIDDPMNDDARFARVQLRQAWATLETLGFDTHRLADTAAHMARARAALDAATEEARTRLCTEIEDGVLLDRAGLARLPAEIALRLLAQLLQTHSGNVYRPRFERLERLYRRVAADAPFAACTLGGCKIAPAPKRHSRFGAHLALIVPEPARGSKREKKIRTPDQGITD